MYAHYQYLTNEKVFYTNPTSQMLQRKGKEREGGEEWVFSPGGFFVLPSFLPPNRQKRPQAVRP
jgi:hypothetical protein